MPGILKSTTTIYEIKLDDMKALIASELNVQEEKIDVSYVIEEVGGDPMDRYPGRREVTKIRVTVRS